MLILFSINTYIHKCTNKHTNVYKHTYMHVHTSTNQSLDIKHENSDIVNDLSYHNTIKKVLYKLLISVHTELKSMIGFRIKLVKFIVQVVTKSASLHRFMYILFYFFKFLFTCSIGFQLKSKFKFEMITMVLAFSI